MWPVFKLAHASAHLLKGYWIIRTQFSAMPPAQRQESVLKWSRQMMALLGVQVEVVGAPIASGLLVANHLSWMDITAIHAAHFCRFIAKSDIKQWPVIGYLTDQSGMLFVERSSRKDAHRVVHAVANQLRLGDCVALFPEGTTGDGSGLLPFHANMFQSAIDADAPVQGVAIRYSDRLTGLNSAVPLYVGDDTLLASVWRVLRAKNLQVSIYFLSSETSNGRDRRAFAADLRQRLQSQLFPEKRA